jgi:hypothetical protein
MAGALLPNVMPGTLLWTGQPWPANPNVAYFADETVNAPSGSAAKAGSEPWLAPLMGDRRPAPGDDLLGPVRRRRPDS